MAISAWVWVNEGTGALNSWDEFFEVTRRANGTFTIGVRRVGIDERGTGYVFRSRPFKRVKRLFNELDRACEAAGRPPFDAAELLRVVSRLIHIDPHLAAEAVLTLSERLWDPARPRPMSRYL
jgi:hypothetical protein